ncbi:ABC transporter [Streptomyces sp. DG2A-72]|uniref:ABC transporter n=1 Tax=Streptomyces sp. DG2A-72 TaxID=3051386 RepID=UPI00265C4431|nr:ABC transporter [Streptomyces sp. DG2A-72]MDO0934283.1 ABC transporter [Streptomyces sp. DG2A-72]
MRGVTALVVPVLRTLPWRVLGASAVAGLLLAGLPRLLGLNAWWALLLLRGAVLAFALGLAFVLDDPARHTTAPVPTRRWIRHALRAVLVAPAAGVWWAGAVWLVPGPVRPPVADVALEAGAVFAVALAAAAAAVHRSDEPAPGTLVAAVLLASAALAPLLLPDDWALFVSVTDERWGAAHDRWAMVLAGAAVVWGVCGAEPLRRRWVRARSGAAA